MWYLQALSLSHKHMYHGGLLSARAPVHRTAEFTYFQSLLHLCAYLGKSGLVACLLLITNDVALGSYSPLRKTLLSLWCSQRQSVFGPLMCAGHPPPHARHPAHLLILLSTPNVMLTVSI